MKSYPPIRKHMPIVRRMEVLLRRWGRNLVRLNASSKQIALGLAVGVFVGWTPVWGVQMAAAALLAALLGGNLVAAMAGTWVTNFATALPFYALAWKLGNLLFRLLGVTQRIAEDKTMVAKLMEFLAKPWKGQLAGMLKASGELWFGCVVLGIVTGLVTYFVTLEVVEGQRRLLAERRARRSAEEQGQASPLNPGRSP